MNEIWCESCGDQVTPHNPGICGTCYAIKYRDQPTPAPAVDAGARDEREAFEQMVWERDRPNREKPPLYRNHERGIPTTYLDPAIEAEWQARAALSAKAEAAAGEPVAQWKDPTKELVAKYWTPSEIGNTLTNVAQILDVVRQEWSAEGSWTEWDQSVRDDITSALRAINAAPPAASGQKLTDEQIDAIAESFTYADGTLSVGRLHSFARAILRASDSTTASDKDSDV